MRDRTARVISAAQSPPIGTPPQMDERLSRELRECERVLAASARTASHLRQENQRLKARNERARSLYSLPKDHSEPHTFDPALPASRIARAGAATASGDSMAAVAHHGRVQSFRKLAESGSVGLAAVTLAMSSAHAVTSCASVPPGLHASNGDTSTAPSAAKAENLEEENARLKERVLYLEEQNERLRVTLSSSYIGYLSSMRVARRRAVRTIQRRWRDRKRVKDWLQLAWTIFARGRFRHLLAGRASRHLADAGDVTVATSTDEAAARIGVQTEADRRQKLISDLVHDAREAARDDLSGNMDSEELTERWAARTWLQVRSN